MPWTELSQRPENLRILVLKTLQGMRKSPQFYFEKKLGLLSDEDLENYLNSLGQIQDNAAGTIDIPYASNPLEMTNADSPGPRRGSSGHAELSDDHSVPREILTEDVRQVRSIGWIRKNGLTVEDRRRADEIYRVTLMNLWYKHVAETGQTYYPPLQNELLDEYTLQGNP